MTMTARENQRFMAQRMKPTVALILEAVEHRAA